MNAIYSSFLKKTIANQIKYNQIYLFFPVQTAWGHARAAYTVKQQ